MAIITNKIYICLPVEKEVDKLDWDGLSTEEYNGKTYYKIPSGGDGSDVVKKITFETLKDNVTVKLNIVSSSEQGCDFAYACYLDGNGGYNNYKGSISGYNKSVTLEYVVPTKGSHWIYIGYIKDYSSNQYNDCGYFSIDNSDKDYVIRQPKEVYLASDKMNEITYGSKKILEYGFDNTISWETLTWDKSNNIYTYNTKGKLYISYSYGNNNYETYLLSSPASVPHPDEITGVNFYNINSYQGNSYNCTYKLDLSEFNTYKFNSMNAMFYNCSSLTNLDISNFNTSNVTNMNNMFGSCRALTSLDVSKWNVGNVTNMNYMFSDCGALTSLDVHNWNTSSVTSMNAMFFYCGKLASLDVSKWNVGNVTNMNNMFGSCRALTSLDVSKWNVGNVTNMDNMFSNCGALTSLIDGHESEPDVVALNGLHKTIKLNSSPKLNYESVYALFRGVAKVTTQTITLPKVMEGKLDASKVKIATDKGWTVAYK